MAKAKSLDAKINALTRTVEKGFAALASDIDHRPTNSSAAEIVKNVVGPMLEQKLEEKLDEKLIPIFNELASLRTELDGLAEKVENILGYRREIDHALERIVAIEKHLGIDKKLAA